MSILEIEDKVVDTLEIQHKAAKATLDSIFLWGNYIDASTEGSDWGSSCEIHVLERSSRLSRHTLIPGFDIQKPIYQYEQETTWSTVVVHKTLGDMYVERSELRPGMTSDVIFMPIKEFYENFTENGQSMWVRDLDGMKGVEVASMTLIPVGYDARPIDVQVAFIPSGVKYYNVIIRIPDIGYVYNPHYDWQA